MFGINVFRINRDQEKILLSALLSLVLGGGFIFWKRSDSAYIFWWIGALCFAAFRGLSTVTPRLTGPDITGKSAGESKEGIPVTSAD